MTICQIYDGTGICRYLESLNEPTPYDHIQNIPNLHCSSDIVPDLLQFPRSQVSIDQI